MKTYTVTVTELTGTRRQHETRVRAEDEHSAAAKGITKLFGKRAGWFRDSGIRTGNYGQVTMPVKTGGQTCITDRARLEVS